MSQSRCCSRKILHLLTEFSKSENLSCRRAGVQELLARTYSETFNLFYSTANGELQISPDIKAALGQVA